MKNQKLLSLLREMLKNSKKSDREIAKRLDVSQATISRLRAKLENEGYIKTYTIIPDFEKLGYEILAFTFTKAKFYPKPEEAERMTQLAIEWMHKHPNIVFAKEGQGLEKDIVMISFHKNYTMYDDFMRTFAMDWGEIIRESKSFVVSLNSGFKMKPLDLKYLAEDK